MTKKIVVFFLSIALAITLFGCIATPETTISFVEIGQNSFKDIYDIDEELNFEKIEVIVKYKSGDALTVPCSADMVFGFDTKTTGDKTLYVSYKGIKSTIKEYKVVNIGNETVSIKTSCRVVLQSEALPNAASYAFSLNIGDLSKVSAISFTIKSDSDIGVTPDKKNVEITNLLTGWQAESYRVDKYTLKILVYKASGLDISKDLSFATLNVIEQEAVTVTVSSITVSDGEKDYYLPNIK